MFRKPEKIVIQWAEALCVTRFLAPTNQCIKYKKKKLLPIRYLIQTIKINTNQSRRKDIKYQLRQRQLVTKTFQLSLKKFNGPLELKLCCCRL